MSTELDTTRLSEMLRSKRGKLGLRIAALEIGDISASTLSRIEQGKVPDVDTFIKICKWLEVSTDDFILNSCENETKSTYQQIEYHLRADTTLSPETLNMLEHVMKMAFDKV